MRRHLPPAEASRIESLAIPGVSSQLEKSDRASSIDEDLLLTLLSESLPPRRASDIAARLTGKRKNDLYQKILSRNFK